MTAMVTEPVPTQMDRLSDNRPLRVLFVKDRIAWPRSSGHDIHTYYLLRAMADAGHAAGLACIERPQPEAIEGIGERDLYLLGENRVPVPPAGRYPIVLSKSQKRFMSYWGVPEDRARWVAAVADDYRADAVVVVGLGVLPYLGAIHNTLCVWYAADEWVWHHLSLVRPFRRSTWSEIKPALVKGLYERAYRSLLDQVWVVSPPDVTAFRWFAGIRQTELLYYGVDAERYAPGTERLHERSCAFWGRLDFGPNIQAVEYFCRKVWPAVRRAEPQARFAIYGFQPTDAVRRWHGHDGITVTADVPDLRPEVRSHPVAVMPFVSGGGVKNKVLEAAAMGIPVVGTPRARNGLRGEVPLIECRTPQDWMKALTLIWDHGETRQELGRSMRQWVAANHTWSAAAEVAVNGLQRLLAGRTRSVER